MTVGLGTRVMTYVALDGPSTKVIVKFPMGPVQWTIIIIISIIITNYLSIYACTQ